MKKKKNKHGSRELPPANLKSQIWADGEHETANGKPPFCRKVSFVSIETM